MEKGLAGLICKLYELSYIERWNDHPKPFHITELDKQAHKSAIAYVVGKFEENLKGETVDWDYLIKGLIFEALQRAVLTDIKPQVFHRLIKEKSKEINGFVFREVGETLRDFSPQLFEDFKDYFTQKETDKGKLMAKRIVKASHFLATYWEFQMIYSSGLRFYGIERVKEEIEDAIEDFFDLAGVERIYLRKKTFNFIDLVGQLRFQKRWIQSPRIPLTTVLGHMFIVASLSYLLSFSIGACERRKLLNFFTGLFHDLPEVTTRDIVAPIKRETNIREILKAYEREQVEKTILPLLPDFLKEEFSYMLGFTENKEVDEFSNRIRKGNKVKKLEFISKKENKNEYDPIDGTLVKACDNLGAYMEAKLSLHHGLTSRHLKEGVRNLRQVLSKTTWENVNFGSIVKYIDRELDGGDVSGESSGT